MVEVSGPMNRNGPVLGSLRVTVNSKGKDKEDPLAWATVKRGADLTGVDTTDVNRSVCRRYYYYRGLHIYSLKSITYSLVV